MYKTLAFIFTQALIQSISAQCIGAGLATEGFTWAPFETEWPAAPLFESAWTVPFATGFGPASLAASNGGGLAVTSSSAIAPTGVSMTSENAYEGPLSVCGAIPFLGAVAVEGILPTIGGGAVTYGCGNGNVAILSEDCAPTLAGPILYDAPLGLAAAPLAYDGLAAPLGYAGYAGAWY